MGLLEMLLNAYPFIKRHRIVGHTDVLLIDRDCPGLEFDWAVLEKFGLGMCRTAAPCLSTMPMAVFFAFDLPVISGKMTVTPPWRKPAALEHGERHSDSRTADGPSGHWLFCAARWKFRRAHRICRDDVPKAFLFWLA